MADVLVNLHGDEHRSRRRVENRLFRRDTFELYERELFPRVMNALLDRLHRQFWVVAQLRPLIWMLAEHLHRRR